jgi:hypothetical protein
MQDEMKRKSSHSKLLAHFHMKIIIFGDIVMFEEENKV